MFSLRMFKALFFHILFFDLSEIYFGGSKNLKRIYKFYYIKYKDAIK